MRYNYNMIIHKLECCKLKLMPINYFIEQGTKEEKFYKENEMLEKKIDFYEKMLKCYMLCALDNLREDDIDEYKNYLINKYQKERKSLLKDLEIVNRIKKSNDNSLSIYDLFISELDESKKSIIIKYIDLYEKRIEKVNDMSKQEIVDIIKETLNLKNIEQGGIEFNKNIQNFYLKLYTKQIYDKVFNLLKKLKELEKSQLEISFNFSYDNLFKDKYMYSSLPCRDIFKIDNANRDYEIICSILNNSEYDDYHKDIEEILRLSSLCVQQKKNRKNKEEYQKTHDELRKIVMKFPKFSIYDSLVSACDKRNYALLNTIANQIDDYVLKFYLYTKSLKSKLEISIKNYELEKENIDNAIKETELELNLLHSQIDINGIIPEDIFLSFLKDNFEENQVEIEIGNYYIQSIVSSKDIIRFNDAITSAESMKLKEKYKINKL